jgi:glycosyltransferase involved in cell wall biosynthesis
MNVSFLNASISRKAGGVFEVQRRLAQNMLETGDIKIDVFGLEDEFTDRDLDLWLPLSPDIHHIKGPVSFGYSPTLVTALKEKKSDLIHLHVIWMYPSIASMQVGIPYITTIHGMLDNWALKNSSFKKWMAAILYEKKALKKASVLQAFTAQEYNDIRNFGVKNPVCIIPNGVDIPTDTDKLKRQNPVWNETIQNNKKVLLFLGRIHPKKGLTNLIKAWETVHNEQKNNDWVLAIAGWDQGGYEDELKKMVKDAQLGNEIFFLGSQFNLQKELCFAHADAFILPSFSEGLPMAVLEAWAYNLPVLMTRQCNLPKGFESGAALQIDTSTRSIADGLLNLFSASQAQLNAIGNAGNNLVRERFNWERVSSEIFKVYEWIVNKGTPPETIIFD